MIPDALRATYHVVKSVILTWKMICFFDLLKPSNSRWNLASVVIEYFDTNTQKNLKYINGFWKLHGVECWFVPLISQVLVGHMGRT